MKLNLLITAIGVESAIKFASSNNEGNNSTTDNDIQGFGKFDNVIATQQPTDQIF